MWTSRTGEREEEAAGLATRRTRHAYFFTHLLEASSHFIVVTFSHAAFVLGPPLAMAAGAIAPKATAARMAALRSFLDIRLSVFCSGGFMITRAEAAPSCLRRPDPRKTNW